MKFRITINKVLDVVNTKDWQDEQPLIDQIERHGGDPKSPTKAELEYAILQCIGDDGIETLAGDLELDETDCEVEVLEGEGRPLRGESDEEEDA